MAVLEGNALLYMVTLLACLGFLLIGFDNGMLLSHRAPRQPHTVLTASGKDLMGGLVDGAAFDATFNIGMYILVVINERPRLTAPRPNNNVRRRPRCSHRCHRKPLRPTQRCKQC